MQARVWICLLCMVLVVAGCQAPQEPTQSYSEMLLTPLASDQIAKSSEISSEDTQAFNNFFSRWGAYSAAVGTNADTQEELYSDLVNMSRNWQSCVTVDNLDGGARVLMYLPDTPGTLDMKAQGGWLSEAVLAYNTQDTEVEAGLAFTVACNALVYALAWEDDMTGVTEVYNACMRALNESGPEMLGSYIYNGYEFTLSIDSDTHYMSFVAKRADRMSQDVLHSGKIYDPADPELQQEQLICQDKLYQYNQTTPSQGEERRQLLHEMLAECGSDVYIEVPFYANWGGKHCHFGDRVYANFGLTCVDDTHIFVGEDTLLGPHVTIATASHPVDPHERAGGRQYNKPVHIGKSCWIGAGAIILPGVTIGDGTTIGAGSIVTHDIPSRSVAVGNPCRVLRHV